VFNALPGFLGGGVRKKKLEPGEMEFILPWQTVYRLDTTVQSITWGGSGGNDEKKIEDYVETRALDGNEVGLSVTVQYRINPEMVHHVVQYVGSSNEQIQKLIAATARADIRTQMNMLKTQDFFSPLKRQAAVNRVKLALEKRLNNEGIIIEAVIYTDHRFERRQADGTYDRSYQEQIDKTQSINQQTERERKRIATVVALKQQEFNEAQAKVNRVVEQAEGYKRQANIRGEAYLQAKRNEAEQIKTVGVAEAEGLRKQVAALSGPGGEALLKLSIAKALAENQPQFVLLNANKGSGAGNIELNKVDTNRLIEQMGIAFGAVESAGTSKTGETPIKPASE
jgi:regulator of protease activity HflC (stomatin/prohibitin superfamily)